MIDSSNYTNCLLSLNIKIICFNYKHSNNTLKIILIQFSGTHEDFGDVSMDETSRETLDRISRETTQSPVVKRSRSRSTTPNDKGSSNKASVQAKMDEAVDIFKKFVTERNTLTAEDNSLKNFCNSIYADLKNLDNIKLIHCKIEIMQVIAKYSE